MSDRATEVSGLPGDFDPDPARGEHFIPRACLHDLPHLLTVSEACALTGLTEPEILEIPEIERRVGGSSTVIRTTSLRACIANALRIRYVPTAPQARAVVATHWYDRLAATYPDLFRAHDGETISYDLRTGQFAFGKDIPEAVDRLLAALHLKETDAVYIMSRAIGRPLPRI